ncbi:3-(3-hydroxyphenyl)propionate hydroxylase [compost metagenome]
MKSVRLSLDGAPGTCRDLSGKYHRYFADAGLQAVLVRPDFYLYGAVSDLGELPQLLDALARDLGIAPTESVTSIHPPLATQV